MKVKNNGSILLFTLSLFIYQLTFSQEGTLETDCGVLDIIEDTTFLDFNNIKPCCLYGAISFKNREFTELPLFEKSQFTALADFSGSSFLQGARFNNSLFYKNACFSGLKINKTLIFYKTQFEQDMVFSQTELNGSSRFVNITVDGTAHFDKMWLKVGINFLASEFYGSLMMNESVIDSTAYFSEITLNSGASFEHAIMNGKVYFNQATLVGPVSFHNTRFGDLLSFSRANIRSEIDFNGATMPDTLILTELQDLHEVIDFTNARFDSNERIQLELTGTQLQKLKFDYSNFRIYFDSSDPDISVSDSIKAKTYLSLLENQRSFGFDRGHKRANMDYMEWTYLSQGQVAKNWVQKNIFNYGQDAITTWLRNTFFLALLVILIYMLVSGRLRVNRA
jgi:uncharacterized protein YjbI with pentapeptide repeats